MDFSSDLSHTVIIIICAILALIPVIIWGYIFYKKHPEARKLVLLAFIGGIVSVTPLLAYKFLWQYFPWINAFIWTRNISADLLGLTHILLVPLPVIVTFMFVGVIEEVSKIFSVRYSSEKYFKSIDDAIELSIIAALGFAFVENIIYFYNIITIRGIEQIFWPFALRSIFSTFAHILFSGIFGYYFGIAHFAAPIYKKEIKRKRYPVISFLHKHFHFRSDVLFKDEKILEGLLIAVFLHAVFNIFLEMQWAFLLVPYVFVGYFWLSYLLKKKENLKEYGHITSR